jgi:hypothetical protein
METVKRCDTKLLAELIVLSGVPGMAILQRLKIQWRKALRIALSTGKQLLRQSLPYVSGKRATFANFSYRISCTPSCFRKQEPFMFLRLKFGKHVFQSHLFQLPFRSRKFSACTTDAFSESLKRYSPEPESLLPSLLPLDSPLAKAQKIENAHRTQLQSHHVFHPPLFLTQSQRQYSPNTAPQGFQVVLYCD